MTPGMIRHQHELTQIAQAYAGLAPDQRAILRARLRAKGIDAARLGIAPFRDRRDRFPLSLGQERLWFLWRLEPESAAYNLATALRFEGALNAAALCFQPAWVRAPSTLKISCCPSWAGRTT